MHYHWREFFMNVEGSHIRKREQGKKRVCM